MNDNIIINIISKTYFSIVSFFVFIFILFCAVFITLQHGLFIDKISISNIHLKQLYIKWNEKIDVSLNELEITKSSNTSSDSFDTSKIGKYFLSLSTTKEWFESFTIQKIIYNDINGTFHYKIGESGFFQAYSKDFILDTSLDLSPHSIQLSITNFIEKKHDISAKGVLYFDTQTNTLSSKINTKFSSDAEFDIYALADIQGAVYKLNSKKKIESLEYLIDLAHLPKEVKYWACDAIGMSYANIEDISGYLKYKDIKNAYKNIHIKATLFDASYDYNPKLDAIHAQRIALEFKKGLFYIYPKEAYSYGMYLDKSWVLIDFTTPKEVQLTVSLLFNAELNKSVLEILNAYKIKLPFLQKKGEVATDLQINVGLESITVSAKGKFQTKDANFDYLGMNIDVADATIFLDNYDVSIKDMHASYADIAHAAVDVAYNAKTSQGTVDFNFDKIKINSLQKERTSSPLHVRYNIIPQHDSISIAPSTWNYLGNTIKLDSVDLPFHLDTLDATIPATLLTLKDVGNAFVSGTFNLKTFLSDIDIDVLHFDYDGITSTQSNTPLHLHYDKKLTVTSEYPIHFTVSGSKYTMQNFFFEINKDKLYLKHTLLSIGAYIQAKIYTTFHLKTKKAHISLTNFTLSDPNTGNLLYTKKKILLSSQILQNQIQIASKEIEGSFVSQDTGWRLHLNSLNSISENSDLLKKLSINNGEFTLYKNKQDKYTRFNVKLTYPYKILLQGKEPTDKYKIEGKIYKDKVYVDINNALHFVINDSIKLKLDHTPVNVIALLDIISKIKNTENTEGQPVNLNITGTNSYLYISKKRKILYDKLDVQYNSNILTAQLHYNKGKAGLKLNKQLFHLYGKDFNDSFMNNLFSVSKFSKGSLDFSMDGKLQEYSGVFYVKNTTIKDYVVLNNILAFINTIPSLMTFKMPGYSTNGLSTKQAFVRFNTKKDHITLKDIYLDSKEMKITGNGEVNTKTKKMEINLTLKSDLGSSLSKIPVLGYAILGQDTISTTLQVSGDFKNPKVKSLVAQDIVVAPLNIIKRTLSLPYKYINEALESNATSK